MKNLSVMCMLVINVLFKDNLLFIYCYLFVLSFSFVGDVKRERDTGKGEEKATLSDATICPPRNNGRRVRLLIDVIPPIIHRQRDVKGVVVSSPLMQTYKR